ncbi:epidermal retinol dehydrogenase 2-like [Sycon ciliatum]|uniref:epidermal retinol dehydrogenase 2-like n=1 Tax=Sycon ciliatum TaxID=27933 RepID=UPI0020AA03A7|eukprot:scpid59967/ scgid7438/ Epidermal retinol dehydrogenase 2; Retinal short-chain dehydrogenase reductase 2; Short-chain dehydrogenase reductase 9; Short-chain dehydrogenase/reductase family 16C member 5
MLQAIRLFFEFISFFVKLLFLTFVFSPLKWLLPKSKKDVAGEVVLITGGGMGMGRLMAIQFAKLNASIVIWDVNKNAMDSVVAEIKSSGKNTQIFSYVVDVSKRQEVFDAAEKVRQEVGDVTILINNAGLVNGTNLLNTPDERIQLLMDVNTTSHLWTLKAFLPFMLTNNHGHIVTVASSAGFFGVNGLIDYCSSKFAAVGLNESLTMELHSKNKTGVKTTVVCPYLVKTGMFEGAASRFDWLIPPLTPEYASRRIVDSVLTDAQLLLMPRILFAFVVLKAIMPTSAYFLIADFFGVTHFMDKFVGRTGKTA